MKVRYILAQVLVVGVWAQRWIKGGSGPYPGSLPLENASGQLLFIFVVAGVPAVVVGLIDGFESGRNESLMARVILTALVLLSALWISLVGQFSIILENFFDQYGGPYSTQSRLVALLGMEVLLLLEWGIAALLSRCRS